MKVTDINIFENSFGDTNTGPCRIANLLIYKIATMGDINSLSRYRHEEQIKYSPITTTRNRSDFRYMTSKEVLDTLWQLNGNKPLGPSQVLGWELRDTAPCTYTPLNFIIKQCYGNAEIPQASKEKCNHAHFQKTVLN